MKEGNAIEVKDITKAFKVYFDRSNNVKDFIIHGNRRHYENRQVLKGISFEVKKGEAVGLIGRNGCGKSTTLKLLTKIMYPDSGTIEMKGRVSSLIELGAGFHPDMSGRENIYINASIFGLSKKEIDKRVNDIIEFSELGDYIDNPVRTYSSGMYMRLAFSVAINVDAEILLIDEILAVGDTNFQTKCFNKMREIKSKGVTIVLVSHDSNMIEKFCSKAIWIDNGYIAKQGKTPEVMDAYFAHMGEKQIERLKMEESQKQEKEEKEKKQKEEFDKQGETTKGAAPEAKEEEIDTTANHFGLKYVELTDCHILNEKGETTSVLENGQNVTIEISYKINQYVEQYVFGIGFYDLEGRCLMGSNTQLDRMTINNIKEKGIVRCKIYNLPLLAGVYGLNIAVVDASGTPLDFYRKYSEFTVVSKDKSTGIFSVKREWEIEG